MNTCNFLPFLQLRTCFILFLRSANLVKESPQWKQFLLFPNWRKVGSSGDGDGIGVDGDGIGVFSFMLNSCCTGCCTKLDCRLFFNALIEVILYQKRSFLEHCPNGLFPPPPSFCMLKKKLNNFLKSELTSVATKFNKICGKNVQLTLKFR